MLVAQARIDILEAARAILALIEGNSRGWSSGLISPAWANSGTQVTSRCALVGNRSLM